ncbi:acyltransferase family protein [Terriglobus sp. RCC_193]|uniref:acyltransferase family protein n=1 Tax=Terriglobus sp. RCC_193 TaxID=3239218 RepID=UPI0035244301
MRPLTLNSLRRVTSSRLYIPEIDGLRFIAIAYVVIFHISELTRFTGAPITQGVLFTPLFTAIHHGARGVPFFFAISGMVLGLPFARHHLAGHDRVALKPYLMRRVTRLEPPYLANLFLRMPLAMAAKHIPLMSGISHLAVSIFYADWIIYGATPAIHPPSWSLAVEVQFYLLAPAIAWVLYRGTDSVRWLVSLALLVGGCFASWYFAGEELHGAARLSILYFSQYFIAGMLMADIYVTSMERIPETFVWDLLAFPSLIAFFLVPDQFARFLLAPIIVIVFLAAFRGRLLRPFLRLPVVSITGGMCYSIYLTHSLTLQGGMAALVWGRDRLGLHPDFWVLYAVALLTIIPLILFIAVIFFVLIERPCMDPHWPHKLMKWLRERPQPQPLQA